MKKTIHAIEKSPEDVPCRDCVNKFRDCPMQIVLAFSRVPQGMEVIVHNCPEKKSRQRSVNIGSEKPATHLAPQKGPADYLGRRAQKLIAHQSKNQGRPYSFC